ncbi:hypothetical protein [Bradyrhizobium oligotrophicum]|uniref:hypothetical protein n=1 Tax=Bradyrhizobium oligotrophicum TaxID=44255 RepID=UPI003EBA2A7E
MITAFPTGSKVSAVTLPWRELPSMLPGFRFLVAAIVCSISLTIFGMGAAALLRAAHEQFVSNASWRTTQASGFTTFLPPAEPTPVLAVLRVDSIPTPPVTPPPVVADAPPAASEPPSAPSTAAPAAETPEATPVAVDTDVPTPSLPAETVDTSRTSAIVETASATNDRFESTKPERPIPDTTASIVVPVEKVSDRPSMDSSPATAAPPPPPASTEAAAAVVSPPPPAPQILASADPMMTTAAAAAPVPAVLDPIAAKLAALAEQPAHQERPAAGEHRASVKVASVQLRRSILKKRQAREKQVAARRAKQRRIAQRVRAARQAAAQLQQQTAFPDPFGQQPFGQPQAAVQQAAGPRTR